MHSNVEIRLKHLEDNIRQDQELLKDYEDYLRYEDDPRRRARYNREIGKLRESANQYQKEYDELSRRTNLFSKEKMQNIAIQLGDMTIKLDRLSAGQQAIYENINFLRTQTLSFYNENEKNLISNITSNINTTQIKSINFILEAIENNKITELEMQDILQNVEQALIILKQNNIAVSSQEELVNAIKAPQLDFKHRLKIALPIIPFIIDYEAEMELGTGLDLKAVWQALLTRFKGE